MNVVRSAMAEITEYSEEVRTLLDSPSDATISATSPRGAMPTPTASASFGFNLAMRAAPPHATTLASTAMRVRTMMGTAKTARAFSNFGI